MPVTLLRCTLAVTKIGGYNESACQGKCDKCGRSSSLDGALMVTKDSIARMFHVCGNCGHETDLLVANITDMPCVPVTLPDITSELSDRNRQTK